MRAVDCPGPALGQTALGCESTRVVVAIQRRVHPAASPPPAGVDVQMLSRLSSPRSFVFHRSGLQRWLRLLCPLLTSPRYSAPVTSRPASILCSTREISRGKTRYLPCIDAGFTKYILLPQMEGFAVTCPLAPDAPRLISGFCSSPRSFGLGFLQTPPRSDALALLLAFGSAKPGHRTFTDEVTRQARRTRLNSPACAAFRRSARVETAGLGVMPKECRIVCMSNSYRRARLAKQTLAFRCIETNDKVVALRRE